MKKNVKKKKWLYWFLNISSNLLLCVGIPALSILVVTPLVTHLLPVALSVALPAMCLGALGYAIKTSFSSVDKWLKNKLVPKENDKVPKTISTQTNEKKNIFQRIWNPDKEMKVTPTFKEVSTQKDEPDLISFEDSKKLINIMDKDNGIDSHIGGMGWL